MNSREAFEQWYLADELFGVVLERGMDDCYKEPEAAWAWEAWQSACQYKDEQDKQEIEQLKKAKDIIAKSHDWLYAEVTRLEAKVAELEAQRVPEVANFTMAPVKADSLSWAWGWNDCRDAMLSAAPADTEQPGICPDCGSGDMRHCNVSLRDYCNECNYWGRSQRDEAKEQPSEAEQEMPPCPKCDYELDQLGNCTHCNQPITAQEAHYALNAAIFLMPRFCEEQASPQLHQLRRYIEQTAQGAAQDREDAQRYRWLRDHSCIIAADGEIYYGPGYRQHEPEYFDQSIDQARQQGKG